MKQLGILLISVIILVGIYFFIFPPRVISVSPANGAQNVSLNSSLIIKFDKPVKRQDLQHIIIPEAYGEWKFEDPLVKNHLFRTLVFVPAIDFEPDTQYQVKLEGIINPLGIGLSGSFSFNFRTQDISLEEIPEKEIETGKQSESKLTLLDIPLDWQDHPLSCEAASLKMALSYKGIFISEEEIMEEIGYDLTPRKGNVWGDPFQAYVGDIDGKICETGYGVYWEPVARAANKWREAEPFLGWNLTDLTREVELENPVIVWGTLPVESLHDCSWFTPKGKHIKAFKETHVRLVIGFIGGADNPSKIILNDPLSGRLYWSTDFFLRNWKTFDYSGVVVR